MIALSKQMTKRWTALPHVRGMVAQGWGRPRIEEALRKQGLSYAHVELAKDIRSFKLSYASRPTVESTPGEKFLKPEVWRVWEGEQSAPYNWICQVSYFDPISEEFIHDWRTVASSRQMKIETVKDRIEDEFTRYQDGFRPGRMEVQVEEAWLREERFRPRR